jgi:hypothetical protein
VSLSERSPYLRLPHSPGAEQAYPCGIIRGGGGPELEIDDFCLPFNRAIFRSIRRLRQEGKPTNDVVLIADELRNPSSVHTAAKAFLRREWQPISLAQSSLKDAGLKVAGVNRDRDLLLTEACR